MTQHATYIREGYYTYKGHQVERLDEAAERYPGDDYYGEWEVTDPTDERWLEHFPTRKAALDAIDATYELIRDRPGYYRVRVCEVTVEVRHGYKGWAIWDNRHLDLPLDQRFVDVARTQKDAIRRAIRYAYTQQ